MRITVLLGSSAIVICSAADAQARFAYAGIEGGLAFPTSQSVDYTAIFGQSPFSGGYIGSLDPGLLTAPAPLTGGSIVRYKRGYDIDAIAGYDFGKLRLEVEIGYSRSKIGSFSQNNQFAVDVTNTLSPAGFYPSEGPGFEFPTTDRKVFNLGNEVSVGSGMMNGLLNFGLGHGVSVYAGPGLGLARVMAFGDSDTAWAWQGIGGIRFSISPQIDLGLKYRYFQTGRVNLTTSRTAFASPLTTTTYISHGGPRGFEVNFTRTADVTGKFNDHISAQSVLLSLVYNFRSAR